MKPRILCAAVHFRNGVKYEHQPKNIENGLVVCGRRHHNALLTLVFLIRFPKRNNKKIIQGFLTSDDRFVDRKEAYLIAKRSGQIISKNIKRNAKSVPLLSEDLY